MCRGRESLDQENEKQAQLFNLSSHYILYIVY